MYIIVARSADRCENQTDVKDFNLQKILIFDTTINLNIQKNHCYFIVLSFHFCRQSSMTAYFIFYRQLYSYQGEC